MILQSNSSSSLAQYPCCADAVLLRGRVHILRAGGVRAGPGLLLQADSADRPHPLLAHDGRAGGLRAGLRNLPTDK